MVKMAMKRKPEASAIFQGFQVLVFCHRRSKASAGTMIRMGNLAGTKWVTGLKTGPSLGCAGKSGRMRISAIAKIVYTAAVEVAAHLYRDACESIAKTSGSAIPIDI